MQFSHLTPLSIKAGLANPPDPNPERPRDWVYGGEDFLRQMSALDSGEDEGANCRRRLDPVAHPFGGPAIEQTTGANGHPGANTPALDRLALEGVRHQRAR